MITFSLGVLATLLKVLLTLAIPLLIIVVAVRVIAAIISSAFRILRGAGGFIGKEVRELLHVVGALVTASVTGVLALCNGLIGRIPTMRHYGRALQGELASGAGSLYRLCFGHPARLVGLGSFAQDLERRVPDLIRNPLSAGRPSTAAESFPGYRIVGTLPAGGSGARLYLAVPLEETTRRWAAAGLTNPGQVVIKSFTLEQGSTVPQIVRESKALEAARRLGRVLDHHLADSSFWYAMPFVPGENLDVVLHRMHADCGEQGLDHQAMVRVMGYARDMLATLHEFHSGGLWHKDVKPSNLIVSSDRVHLVDLGLVTPLASAMTLTTHGTEYYRDPELVRLAMRGVRVHEVNGAKFDLYSAGAVIYSMIEDGFPAQGSLSPINKRCPEALAWIVRRAMADVERRYESALEMAHDLDVLLVASDPFALKPADLPSMGAGEAPLGKVHWLGSPPQPHSSVEPPPLTFTGPKKAPFAARGQGSRRGFKVISLGLAAAAAAGILTLGAMMWGLPSGTPFSSESSPVAHSGSPSPPITPGTPQARTASASPEEHWSSETWLKRKDMQRVIDLASDEPLLFLLGVGVDSASPLVSRMTQELEGAGVHIAGQPGDTNEDSIEWLAQARRAVELGEPSDPLARLRVQHFLDSQAPDLLGVVWFTPGERKGEVNHHLLLAKR
jgi:serine/threonine protein kinase